MDILSLKSLKNYFMKKSILIFIIVFIIQGFFYFGFDPLDDVQVGAQPAFSSGLLVHNGVGLARIVVGTLNPDPDGLFADQESANLVNKALGNNFKTLVGGNIFSLVYPEEDLDGDLETAVYSSNVGDDFGVIDTSIEIGGMKGDDYDDKWLVTDLSTHGTAGVIPLSANWLLNETSPSNAGERGLWKDSDGDGSIHDFTDWPLYNDIKILDWERGFIDILPALRVGGLNALLGSVVSIKGTSYAVMDYDPGRALVELVKVDEITIISVTEAQDILETAVPLLGSGKRIGLKGLGMDGGGATGSFAIIANGSILNFYPRSSSTNPPLTIGRDLEVTGDLILIPTEINAAGGYIRLAVGFRKDILTVHNGDIDVFGYSKAFVGDSDEGWIDELRFEDPMLTIYRGKFKRLGDTDNYFIYTPNREIDIWRQSSRHGRVDEERLIPLELTVIKDDQISEDDKNSYNLLLIGGPIANNLTRDLVSNGRSRVNWFESEGEIEVLEDAYMFNRFIIIVAGRDRFATKTAVETLTAML